MTRADIIQQLKEFIGRELIMTSELAIEDNEPLITGGLIDSFSLAYIGVFIEVTFGVYIPDTDLTVDNLDTLGQMADRVLRDLPR